MVCSFLHASKSLSIPPHTPHRSHKLFSTGRKLLKTIKTLQMKRNLLKSMSKFLKWRDCAAQGKVIEFQKALKLRHFLNAFQIPCEWKPLPLYLCWGMRDEFGVSIQCLWSSHSDHKVTTTPCSNWHSYWQNQQDLMAMETELPSLTLQTYWWGRGDVCLSLTILLQLEEKQRDFSFQGCQSGIFHQKETH